MGQQPVAGVVAEDVVHVLEVIEVEHDQAQPAQPVGGALGQFVEPLVEQSAVGQAGEGVVLGRPARLDLGEDEFVNVLGIAVPADDVAVVVAARKGARPHPAIAAVRHLEAAAQIVRRAVQQRGADAGLHAGQVFRVKHVHPAQEAERLFLLDADQLQIAFGDARDPLVVVGDPGELRIEFHRVPEMLDGAVEVGDLLAFLGAVHEGDEQRAPAVVVGRGAEAGIDMEHRPVRGAAGDRDRDRRPGQGLAHGADDDGPLLAVDQAQHGLAGQAAARSEQAGGAAIGPDSADEGGNEGGPQAGEVERLGGHRRIAKRHGAGLARVGSGTAG